ncbi:hypothetical protein D7027_02020 [Ochrobactrum intermedium]|uniref:hypothetical protein n=1 Tax=Brucella intermedia TaxID=94625 RepID=UPI00128B7D02|nr:hypothetical protein [Brucella intermedia]MPR60608.1 hypothetical protein [Brucella intermedia]
MKFDFQFDERALRKTFQTLEKDVLQKAAAKFLDEQAFTARQHLKDHLSEAFDGHVPFTERAFLVRKAKPQANLSAMSSEIVIQPRQAAYLKFQIQGGIRRTGDSGSGPHDLFVFGAKTNRAGNIKWGFVRELSKQNKTEKSARKEFAQRKMSIRERRKWDMSQYEPGTYQERLTFTAANRNKPGIFFGTVSGVKGYWKRPQLTKAALKRKRGVISVRPKGSSKLTPLLTVNTLANYKPRFMYQQQIDKALRSKATSQAFAHEVNRQMSKITR